MSYGISHSATIPTVSVTTGPTYATLINAAIQEIRDTVDAKVTPAGIDINASLSFLSGATYNAATNLGKVNFENKSSVIAAAANPNSLFVKSGELYYNDNSSQQVQVTLAGALNVSATGGITGSGYGSSGVEVNWNTANTEYRLKAGSGTDDYAHVKVNDLLLNDGSGNFIRQAAPAIASDYTVTWPNATPGSTLPVLMDSSGTLTASGTLANLVTATTSGTITSGGLITASAGLTAAAGQHVTVSTTGRFKHGEYTLIIPTAMGEAAGAAMALGPTTGRWLFTGAANESVSYPISLPVGARIKAFEVWAVFDSTDSKTVTLYSRVGGAAAVSESTSTSTTDFGSSELPYLTSGLTLTVAADQQYWIYVTSLGATDTTGAVNVTYDMP